jgi:uncharacterized protein (TIGR02757 family)
LGLNKTDFENLYLTFNKRELVHPDPLEFLYSYPEPFDAEIVGLIASSLAYGRVAQILKSIQKVLEPLGTSPSTFIAKTPAKDFDEIFAGFKHRFTTGDDLARLFRSIKKILESHGSLENCFKLGIKKSDNTLIPALEKFVEILSQEFENQSTYLLPCPSRGSACKRLNLYLRWMVRQDDVDPGSWSDIPSRLLVIPLDTHMENICKTLGMTSRKAADLKTALEITEAFRKINPKDPVKYDFALTRFGIRDDLKINDLFN